MHKQAIITMLALASGCLLLQAQNRPASDPTPAPTREGRTVVTTSNELLAQNEALGQEKLEDKPRAELEEKLTAEADQLNAAELNAADIAFQNFGGWKLDSGGRSQSLTVATTQTNAEGLAALDEDLSVMSLLLDKSVAASMRPNQDQMLGININVFSGAHSPQNLYIEGQGALFIRHVKMALLPGNARDKEKAVSKKDSAWEEAKRDLYGPRNARIKFQTTSRESRAPYDAEKVDHLTREVVGAMKNAANIRGLGVNESVTVVLLGSPEVQLGDIFVREGDKKVVTAIHSRDGHSSTMTIKVKKADAEAALNGSIDSAELQRRAAISVY